MRSLTNRQKQAVATKLRITEIATNLFKKKGFESVKIQDICDAAKISTGAFYHHFKSKAEIINTGYEQIDLLLMDKFESKMFSSNMDKILCLFGDGADLLQDLGWVFVGEVYKNIISIDGKYTFKPDRFLTLEIKSAIESAMENNELQCTISSTDLTEILLRTSRGVIFDWCLHQGIYNLRASIIFDLKLILSNYKNNS